ncbi:uncharacterized protein TERG_02277 [Trichophyton rubrum CBS 118892]|uniref:Transcription initiation factor IIA subunit 2 n=1 Tax=Trichophyton rubrum (strain ATCC MYA-4607 / CBS 118892) TaxID=559305 RepID=F2SGF5_TRIRC|nr:uncharacterized protein TERG_02277 [Trichophyton rubrum CBS 118892]EGD86011.2 hypothetical protein TERG_02277 [Trichophyton rubrum CBS 118892]
MSAPAYYELYRGSSIGLSLTDTLDDLINEGRIEPQLAMKILSNFDRVITEVLADKVKCKLSFKVCILAGQENGLNECEPPHATVG